MRAASPWADFAPRTLSALVLLPLVLACIWWGGASWSSLMAVCVVMLVMEWWTMTGAGKLGVAPFLAGVGYIALAVLSLLWLRADPATGRANILFLLIVIWATDIGAYLVGRAFGVAMLTGLALSARWPHGAWTATLLLAALISVASQAGDLLESAAKRRCGVKDSGRLIPGHGGLLDRVDGVLFAAPVMAALGLCLGREIVLWS
jgi:phosphatidate cytidylyltransferase